MTQRYLGSFCLLIVASAGCAGAGADDERVWDDAELGALVAVTLPAGASKLTSCRSLIGSIEPSSWNAVAHTDTPSSSRPTMCCMSRRSRSPSACIHQFCAIVVADVADVPICPMPKRAVTPASAA